MTAFAGGNAAPTVVPSKKSAAAKSAPAKATEAK
jgi:hypothetical protein